MLLSLLSGDFKTAVLSLLISLPVILFALSIHEVAHGFVAYKCGDRTAYNLGRLTLNPIKHLDPMGFLCMLVFGFGWAKPVPVNTRNFKNHKRGMALTAAAGPAANLIMGLLSAVLYGLCWAWYSFSVFTRSSEFLVMLAYWCAQLFSISALLNFIYMTFNLIPVPPFDGSRIALVFLPERAYFGIMKYERQIMLGILIALFLLSRLFHFSPFSFVAEKLTALVASPICEFFIQIFAKAL
jgi:Zn-dependent protease